MRSEGFIQFVPGEKKLAAVFVIHSANEANWTKSDLDLQLCIDDVH